MLVVCFIRMKLPMHHMGIANRNIPDVFCATASSDVKDVQSIRASVSICSTAPTTISSWFYRAWIS